MWRKQVEKTVWSTHLNCQQFSPPFLFIQTNPYLVDMANAYTLSYQVGGDVVRTVKSCPGIFPFDVAIDDFFTRLLTLTSYLRRRCIRFIGEILSLIEGLLLLLFVKSILCLMKCLFLALSIHFSLNPWEFHLHSFFCFLLSNYPSKCVPCWPNFGRFVETCHNADDPVWTQSASPLLS